MLTAPTLPANPVRSNGTAPRTRGDFLPTAPGTLEEAGLSVSLVDSLILKYLLNTGLAVGTQIAKQIRLPFGLISELLRRMKHEQLVVYRRSCGLNDFEYELTSQGYERARRLFDQCTYFGTAPVSLAEYVASVEAQSPTRERPTAAALQAALGDLHVKPEIFSQLGQALTYVGAVFLYGAPGNGKTSIAERLTAVFGPTIWIPRAIYIEGEIIRVFDPTLHEEVPAPAALAGDGRVDQRWVHIRRPTVVVGGELTLENLEMRLDNSTGIVESPVQMKSNCGTLVIDDFGRQRVGSRQLLNRWIVPLEKRHDYLNTPFGKKIQVPFEQLVIFATNLEPKELVDEAFLRRIPYKVEVCDPTEAEFRGLFRSMAPKFGMAPRDEMVDYLIATHYQPAERPFRYCHVRDLLLQVRNHCNFLDRDPEITRESLDAAAQNYFVMM